MNEKFQQDANESFWSLQDVFNLVLFIWRSVLRHKLIVLVVIVVTISLAVVALKYMPRTYMVTTRVMTNQSGVISELTRPGSPMNSYAKKATQNVVELMKSRENLIGIIDDTNLVTRWKKTRTQVGRWADAVRAKLWGPLSDKDIHETLIDIVDGRFQAWVENNIIVISVAWHDPKTAFEMENIILKRFFDERRQHEMGEIKETLLILERKMNSADQTLQKIAKKSATVLQKASDIEKQTVPVKSKVTYRTRTKATDSKEYQLVKQELNSVTDEISRLTQSHKQRLNAALQKLSEVESMYGAQHPEVIKAQRYIELLQNQKPVSDKLITRKRELENALVRLGREATTEARPSLIRRAAALQNTASETKTAVAVAEAELSEMNVEVELTTVEYRNAEAVVNNLRQRLTNARLELEAAEAAFMYRYRITRPPTFPKGPVKPSPKKIMAAAVVLSIFLGVFLAVFIDIRSRIIIETWQVEKILNIPLLGEVDKS